MTTRKKTTATKKPADSTNKPTEMWGYFNLTEELDTELTDYTISDSFATRSEAFEAGKKATLEYRWSGFALVHATFYKANTTLEQF